MSKSVKSVSFFLIVATLAVACGQSPAGPIMPDAALASTPAMQVAETSNLQNMTDRELLIAVLDELRGLESRVEAASEAMFEGVSEVLGPEAANVYLERVRLVRPAVPGQGQGAGQGQGGGQGQGNTPGGSPSPQQPWGVPQQLADLRAQVGQLIADNQRLEDKINDITVGIGLPAPPDADLTLAEVFDLTAKVCVSIGPSASVSLTASRGPSATITGKAGIDFYGNELTFAAGGGASLNAGVTLNPIAVNANYTICVNELRPEAADILAALPFGGVQGFKSRMPALTGEVGALRIRPTDLFKNATLLGETPTSVSALLGDIDTYFMGVRSDICMKMSGDFGNVTATLDKAMDDKLSGGLLGDGLKEAYDQAVSGFKATFTNRCATG